MHSGSWRMAVSHFWLALLVVKHMYWIVCSLCSRQRQKRWRLPPVPVWRLRTLGGNTIHSWAGIDIHDEVKKYMIAEMSKSRRDQIVGADILVIDEVSMLHDYRLDMVEEVCRRKCGKTTDHLGGTTGRALWWLFQLPPINRDEGRQGGFIVGSRSLGKPWPNNLLYRRTAQTGRWSTTRDFDCTSAGNDPRRRHAEALLERKMYRHHLTGSDRTIYQERRRR